LSTARALFCGASVSASLKHFSLFGRAKTGARAKKYILFALIQLLCGQKAKIASILRESLRKVRKALLRRLHGAKTTSNPRRSVTYNLPHTSLLAGSFQGRNEVYGRGGIRNQKGGIWDHSPGIRDQRPWDRDQKFFREQGSGCTIFVG